MLVYPKGSENSFQGDIPDYCNDDYYNVDYTRAQIGAYLRRVKECIRAGRFIVLDNESVSGGSRKKNRDFMLVHGLYEIERQKSLLLSLDVDDFCHTVRSSTGETLYVFCAQWSLYRTGYGPCSVWVYVKHNCPEGNCVTDVVVSMHELEKPIELIFVD